MPAVLNVYTPPAMPGSAIKEMPATRRQTYLETNLGKLTRTCRQSSGRQAIAGANFSRYVPGSLPKGLTLPTKSAQWNKQESESFLTLSTRQPEPVFDQMSSEQMGPVRWRSQRETAN